MLSILARQTEVLDAADLRLLRLSEVSQFFNKRRYEVFRQISRLLSRPMSVSQLDDQTLKAFAANLLVTVVQMVGRGIRQRMPVEVYFIDAAWAPRNAEGQPDTARSSVLIAMQEVLLHCLSTRNSVEREIYQELYGPFAKAFLEIDGVMPPDTYRNDETHEFDPSVAGLEDGMDGWDPDDGLSVSKEEDSRESEN